MIISCQIIEKNVFLKYLPCFNRLIFRLFYLIFDYLDDIIKILTW